jgi:2-C-methyl-D-erythritol 4-phosphate cytidylyltransferase
MSLTQKRSVVIVAGGSGKRMGADVPKQFLLLKSRPILMHTIEAFYNFDNSINIVLVLPQANILQWEELCKEYGFYIGSIIVVGGKERFCSVKNGLNFVENNSITAIHDGARPFVSIETISNCFDTAERLGNAVPVVPVSESVRIVENGKSSTIARSNLRLVQTPQVFNSDILKKAYLQPFCESFTDDASVVEAFGQTINLVEGNIENFKITTPADFRIAEKVAGLLFKKKGKY